MTAAKSQGSAARTGNGTALASDGPAVAGNGTATAGSSTAAASTSTSTTAAGIGPTVASNGTTAASTSTTAAGNGVAVVSGGSRGLGQVLVGRLLREGWRVATFSRSVSPFLERASAEAGDRFFWQAADLAEPSTLRAFVREVSRRFDRIDLLVNNAAVLEPGLLLTLPVKQIDRLITVNLVAPIALAQACARAMSARGGGAIVNISSINAIRGFRGVAVYSAAKAGVEGFSRSLARELGPLGVRVNCVVPGFFDSEMTAGVGEMNRDRILRRTPLGRLVSARDVAEAVVFLASPGATAVTGQTIVVDGGITC